MEQQPLYTRSLTNVESDYVLILNAVDLNRVTLRHTLGTDQPTSFTHPLYVILHHHNHINEVRTGTRNIEETIQRHSYRNLSRIRVEEGKESEAMTCSICLAELLVGSKATQLPCSHLYHKGCITKWLDRSNTCPLCRQIVPNM